MSKTTDDIRVVEPGIRLRVKPDPEGNPDPETYGDGEAFGLIAEWQCECCGAWVVGDSIWGMVGYDDIFDPEQNPYVPDLIAGAKDARDQKRPTRGPLKARIEKTKG